MNATLIRPYPSSFPVPTSTQVSPTSVKLVIPFLVLAAGTGGIMTAHSTAEVLDHWLHYPRIHIEQSVAKNGDVRSPAEMVANIRDVLGINMSDLASLLGVTRPTVYAWFEGQEPKPEAVKHIQRLSHVADKLNRADIVRLDKLVHRPILDGRSLLDILKSDEDPIDALNILKALADKENQTRCESKGFGKNLRSLNDVLSESSLAAYERG